MKKTTFVLLMAAVLVLSFSAVAMAKYAGYAYNTPLAGETAQNENVGYLSWNGAVELMDANGVAPELQASPHGGYTAATTKCAVCHSTHRAATELTAAGVGAYWKLTPGGSSCTACHTPHGANPTGALVEWSETYADGGPHNRQQCTGACHAGIHGAGGSKYGAMNKFNLTANADALIEAAFAAGNVNESTSTPAGSNPTGGYGLINEASFLAGTTANGEVEGIARSGNTLLNDDGNMRAMATGYTCGQVGCHTASQFAVNRNGYAELRSGNPAGTSSTDLNFAMTGHITNMTSGCAPCHRNASDGRDGSKCAVCHDMIGTATNTTAFPHSNRNISIQERLTDGADWTPREIGRTYNLWMYAGDATYRDASGEPSSTPANGVTSAGLQARTLIEGATGFGLHEAGKAGNINDGTCMKCHGYEYWATHGNQATGSHALGKEVNFSMW